MKKLLPYILLIEFFLYSGSTYAQLDPDKVCRIVDGKLIFTLNLKWTEKEKNEVAALFDLDSVLMVRVYSGNTVVVVNDETWKVKKISADLVELSKPIEPEIMTRTKGSVPILLIDQWMGFAGKEAVSPVNFGVNHFDLSNAFVYTGKNAQFFLPGYDRAQKVYIAGTFNNWSTTGSPMRRAGNGWMVDLKLVPGKYTYKYIVDGRWITDPGNMLREKGDAGAYNSVVYCNNHIFRLKGYLNARKVVVTGNFINWKPDGLAMSRTQDGWSFPVYLRDGTYAYKFLVDNRWMTDPANPVIRKDAYGNENSFIGIGEPFIFKLNGFTDAKKIVLTGSFNNWDRGELVMDKTATGWQLSYTIPAGNYEYKFIKDGTWMTDPANPFSSGTGATQNSFIALKANHLFELKKFPGAKDVIVTGSFNGWNQKGFRMVREGSKWIFPIYLPPGKYTYKFIVDGNWILDPDNALYEQNEYDTNNSVLWMEPTK